MPRSRVLHYQFFSDAKLYDAEKASDLPLRLAYEGLWCVADREGRFEWKPRELKLAILPYDEVDMGGVMNALVSAGFVVHYSVGGIECGWIPKFHKWQHIHPKEAASKLPSPEQAVELPGTARELPVIPGASTSTSASASTPKSIVAPATSNGHKGKHPKPPRRDPPVHANWVNEAVQIHETHIGDIAHGKLGKLLKPLVDKRGWEMVKPVWEWFCEFGSVADYLARVEAGTVREGEHPVKTFGYKTTPQYFVEHFTALAREVMA